LNGRQRFRGAIVSDTGVLIAGSENPGGTVSRAFLSLILSHSPADMQNVTVVRMNHMTETFNDGGSESKDVARASRDHSGINV